MLKLIREENENELPAQKVGVIEIKPEEDIIQTIEEPAADQTVEELPKEEIDTQVSDNACEDVVLTIVQGAWQLIGEINTAIATLDYNYSKENKEDIKKILEGITDDLTVDIGMLYKISDMMNAKTEKLLDTGMEKAEDLAKE